MRGCRFPPSPKRDAGYNAFANNKPSTPIATRTASPGAASPRKQTATGPHSNRTNPTRIGNRAQNAASLL